MKKRLKSFDAALVATLGTVATLLGLLWMVGTPTAGQQLTPAGARPVLKAYPCPAESAQDLAARLHNEFGGAAGVRIAVDQRVGQILVQAPPEVQVRIAQRLGAQPPQVRPQPSVSPPPANPAAVPRVDPQLPTSRTVPLRQISAQQIESTLVKILGNRLTSVPGAGPDVRNYQLALPGNRRIDLGIHYQANRVTIQGAGLAVDSGVRLIYALDSPPPAENQSTRLVSLRLADPAVVRRAVDAIRVANVVADPSRGRFVTMLFQQAERESPAAQLVAEPGAGPAAQPAVPNGAVEGPPPPPAPTGEAPQEGGGLIGPVQIEVLEGLDVIVIRGHQRDVEEVMRIIEQIEALSAETVPAVDIYHLQHVGSQALADLLGPLYDEVYLPRQGSVQITALVKPNSLLLIGRTEGVQTVIDLVKRLDRPVPPNTQLRVFRLRHAAALPTEETITQFYEDERGGLGAQVLVTSDYRSNALVVQANPRDMVEVAELIARLDTPVSATVNELRVFKLDNALAEELAPILQYAITGQTYGGMAGAGPGAAGMPGGVPTGAAGAARAGAAGLGTEQKSTMLQFLTIDARGQQRLKSGILTDVRITAESRANALLVSAPPDSMDLLEALIRQLDRLPPAETQVKVFTIVNGDAADMLQMLETLFGQPTTAGEPLMQTSALEGESSLVSLRFAYDVRTNSIITSGTLGDLSVVEAILLRLDASDVRQRESTVYRLKNAPASDVSEAINEFLRVEREVLETTPGLLSAFEQIEREVVVVAEPVSNSLIISATPRFYQDIMKLVREIDEQPEMVVIQVLIAEVTLGDLEEFGIELGLQDSILFDRAKIFNFNNVPLGEDEVHPRILGSQGLSGFGMGRTSAQLGYGGLVLSASSETVSILVRALKESRRLDVLARPQIMTLDNQPAQIQVGQIVSRVRGTSVSLNIQSTNVEDEDVGLILGVVPRVTPEGVVVMEIRATQSELGDEADGTPVGVVEGQVLRSPPINITTAETTIAAADGQTVVLGGLITKRKATARRSVPVLGELPIVGRLFRFDSDGWDRRELLIILTPRVVRSPADAEAIKQVEVARMHWCLADVIEAHGDGGLRGRSDEWTDSETMVIYPDMEPGAEMIHTPERPPETPEVTPRPKENPFRLEPMPAPGGSPRLPTPAPQDGPPPAVIPEPSAGARLQLRSADQAVYQPPRYVGGVQRAVYPPPGARVTGVYGVADPVVRSSYDTPSPAYPRPPAAPPATTSWVDPRMPQYR